MNTEYTPDTPIIEPIESYTPDSPITEPNEQPKSSFTRDIAQKYMFKDSPDTENEDDILHYVASKIRVNPQNYFSKDDNPNTSAFDIAKAKTQAEEKLAQYNLDPKKADQVIQLLNNPEVGVADGSLEDFISANAKEARSKGYFTLGNYAMPNLASTDKKAGFLEKGANTLADVSEVLGHGVGALGTQFIAGPVQNQQSQEGIKQAQENIKTINTPSEMATELATPDWAVSEGKKALREISAYVTPGLNGAKVGGVLAKVPGIFKGLKDKEILIKAEAFLNNPTLMTKTARTELLKDIELEAMKIKGVIGGEISSKMDKIKSAVQTTMERLLPQIGKQAIEQAPITAVQMEKHTGDEYSAKEPILDAVGLGIGSTLGGLFKAYQTRPFAYERELALNKGIPKEAIGYNIAEGKGGNNIWSPANLTAKTSEIIKDIMNIKTFLRKNGVASLEKDGTLSEAQKVDFNKFLEKLKGSLTTNGANNAENTQNVFAQKEITKLQETLPEIKSNVDIENYAHEMNKGQSKFVSNPDLSTVHSDLGTQKIAKEVRNYLATKNLNFSQVKLGQQDLNEISQKFNIKEVGENKTDIAEKLEVKLNELGGKLYQESKSGSVSNHLKNFHKGMTEFLDKKSKEIPQLMINDKSDFEFLKTVLPQEKLNKLESLASQNGERIDYTDFFKKVFKNPKTENTDIVAVAKHNASIENSKKEFVNEARKAYEEVIQNMKIKGLGDFEKSLVASNAYKRMLNNQWDENAKFYGSSWGIAAARATYRNFILNTAKNAVSKGTGQLAVEPLR